MSKVLVRLAWVSVAAVGLRAMGAGLASVEDVRVDALVDSHWGQKTDSGYVTGNPCFNYYTPSNYPCGCVAVPLAQLCRYWKYPESVEADRALCLVDGEERTLDFGGSVYDYDAMPAMAAGAGEETRQALGRLMRDWAVALHSQFSASGTLAYGSFSFVQLRQVFGYASAVGYVPFKSVSTTSELENTIMANLDARCPVAIIIKSSANNNVHQALIDGYGYNGGKLYFHFNMGWYNVRNDDAWYELDGAEGTTAGVAYRYDRIEGLVYNVFPESTGDVLSGRVLDEGGLPVAAAEVKVMYGGKAVCSGRTDGRGIYAFVLEGGKTYSLSCGGSSLTVALRASECAKRMLTRSKVGEIWENPLMPAYNEEGVLGGSAGNDIRLGEPATGCGPFNPTKAGKGDYPYSGVVTDAAGVPCGIMKVTFTKPTRKGVSKISAKLTMLDGKSYSVPATSVATSEAESAVITDKTIRKFGVLDRLEVGSDGFAAEMTLVNGEKIAAVTTDLSAGLPQGTYAVGMDEFPSQIGKFPVLTELSPDGTSLTVGKKGKISLAKAATVKYAKIKGTKPAAYQLVVDTTKGKTNLSALKLTYTANTSSVKGSFYVYTDDATRHRVNKLKFSVNGLVIGGRIQAVATCKSPALSLQMAIGRDEE